MNKILFVSPTAILGGAERVMFNLALEYLERGDEVFFYVMSRGEQPGWERLIEFESFHLIIKNYPSEKSSLFDFVKSIYKLSKNNELDFIFSSHTHINGVLSMMRKLSLLKCKYLVSRESTVIFERFTGIKKIIFSTIYRFAYGKQDLIVCQTNYMKDSLLNSLGFNPARKGLVEVINNPVNLKYIKERKGIPDIDREIIETGYVVACGRFVKLKQFDKLVLAFSKSLYITTSLYLVLIGDGPCFEDIKDLIADLGMSDRVFLLGKLDNPIPFFQFAKLGVISSEIEGFPNVLIEMMASGIKNIITTPCTDAVNYIPNISVTKDISADELEKSFYNFFTENNDQSLNYIEFIKNNYTVNNFISKVEVITTGSLN